MIVLVDVGCDCNDCTGLLVSPQTSVPIVLIDVDAVKGDAGDAFQRPRLIVIDQDFGRSQHAAAGVRRQGLDNDVRNALGRAARR